MRNSNNLIYENKNDFRKECIEKLQFNSNISKIKKDKYICSKILELILLHRPKKILAYIPLNLEVNILPLITQLRKKQICEVYVPYITGKTFKIVKYRLPLNKKQYNLREPNNSNLKAILDIAIVPIVGTDKTSRRVGFGRGMYDRFFATLKSKPITIFTQLILCKNEIEITSYHDIKADFIITT
jgi:5-formyltetrahydrofolate cyclo-ligase